MDTQDCCIVHSPMYFFSSRKYRIYSILFFNCLFILFFLHIPSIFTYYTLCVSSESAIKCTEHCQLDNETETLANIVLEVLRLYMRTLVANLH